MTALEGQTPSKAACAAVVLYRPDPALLARQAEGLRGIPLFAFANGPVEADALAALAPADLRLMESPDNVGLGRGLNAVLDAAAAAGFAHVLLLDQDSEPTADILAALASRALALELAGERIAILAPRLVPPEEGFYKPIRYEWRGEPQPDGLATVDFAPTSGSLLNLAAYREIGPFRDDFFIAGLDVEWGFRAWSKGWASYVVTSLAMPHRWGEAVSEAELGKPQILRHAPIRNYYYARNVIATARLRHVPLFWRIKSCVGLAAQVGLLALKGPRGALRPIQAGLRDGLKGRLGPAPEGMG
ncbi:glycosyltransferase family 2 protein [Bosea sp. UNC402CLCol]|uniref:glycosyltransferase family 2 protein n=1 Tax=Bosea sp. UNC402CLCol TaxID=1510531 RepID=UPI0012E01B43|nr:glycosyltransferase family 2 protein [Bosea sp. UNC402CLCol]